jgi:nucleotide-binding universal stress UspA family protein
MTRERVRPFCAPLWLEGIFRWGGGPEHTVGVLRRILLAFDDSAPARRALEEAVCLARDEGARLIVVAVEEGLARFDGGTASEILEEHEQRQDDCRLWLWAAEAYARSRGVPVTTELRAGVVAQQLAAAAAAHRADLVVVGRDSHLGVLRRIGHTKAERLARISDRPVLIVSEQAPAPAQDADLAASRRPAGQLSSALTAAVPAAGDGLAALSSRASTWPIASSRADSSRSARSA